MTRTSWWPTSTTCSSAPPCSTFAHIPVVQSRHPLWADPRPHTVVTGLATDRREVLITDVFDATPDHRQYLDGASLWPLLTAVAVGIGIIVALFTPWGI